MTNKKFRTEKECRAKKKLKNKRRKISKLKTKLAKEKEALQTET